MRATRGLLARIGVLLALNGCGSAHGSDPRGLAQLRNVQLSVVVDFNPPQPPPTPGVIVAMSFDSYGTCPDLNLTATLDGVPLDFSPGVSGLTGDTCLVGYYLSQSAPMTPQSVLDISDGTNHTTLTATNLLQPRTLSTDWPDGGTARGGDVISFAWSMGTDAVIGAEAYFYGPDGGALAAHTQAGDASATVIVPPLSAGPWTLETTVGAGAPVDRCVGASACSADVYAKSVLSVIAP